MNYEIIMYNTALFPVITDFGLQCKYQPHNNGIVSSLVEMFSLIRETTVLEHLRVDLCEGKAGTGLPTANTSQTRLVLHYAVRYTHLTAQSRQEQDNLSSKKSYMYTYTHVDKQGTIDDCNTTSPGI